MKESLILTYHNIVSPEKDLLLYDVNLDNFKQQIECLRDTKIIPSFDDGYKSWANEVLEILKENNINAYFFICIEYLENGSISESDILKLKNNGMVIGSHSLSHCFLHVLSNKEIHYELSRSRAILEDITGSKISCFSIPRGVYDRRVVSIAKKVGYKNIFTSDIGINKGDNFVFKRIAIKRNTNIEIFKDILRGKKIINMRISQKIKDFAKSVLGIKNYNFLRSVTISKAE